MNRQATVFEQTNMKTTLRISLILNLALLGSLIFHLANRRHQAATAPPVSSRSKSLPLAVARPAPAAQESKPAPFRWSQLEPSKNYRAYIANLRAIGCPEQTIEDIVQGDVERTFAWERGQLGLDDSDAGRWSRQAGRQFAASLCGQRPGAGTTTVAQDASNQREGSRSGEATGTVAFAQKAGNQTEEDANGEIASASVFPQGATSASPGYRLFHRNVNGNSPVFTASRQAALSQVPQQYPGEDVAAASAPNNTANPSLGSENPNPNSSPNSSPQDPLTISAQDRMRNNLIKYYRWYQPQAVAAAASGQPLNINPDASPSN